MRFLPKLYFRYLFKIYGKNFLLILTSISLLYLLVDIVGHYSHLPNSSNLQILYGYYTFLYGVDFLYPLALLFGFLLTIYQLIRRNELVALYSGGLQQIDLLKPILAIGAGVTLLFYVLDSTQFTYSIEKAKAILHGGGSWSKDSYFLKWNGRIISIRKLNPMVGKAEDINIFYLSPQNRLTKVISAKIARYQEESNGWVAPEANITTITPEKMERKVVKNYHFLEAFKPKVVYNLKSVDTISFTDAYYALKYFKNLDVNVILGIVFFKIFTPLLVLVMIIFTFLSAPLQTRTGNLPLFMIKFALLGVLIWGIELLLFKFTKQGVLPIYLLALPPLMGGVGVVYKILRS